MTKSGVALLILENVILNNIPFNISCKTIFKTQNVARELRSDISGLVGCELRHHLLFVEIVKEELGIITEKDCLTILLAMANFLFYKKIDQKELNDLVCTTHKFNKKSFDEFLKKNVDKKDLIPSKFTSGSEEYLSLRFNTPLWLVKMWMKHYGRGLLYKILKSNYHQAEQVYGYFDLSENEVLSDGNFIKNKVDGLINYVGKDSIKKHPFYVNSKIYTQNMAIKSILNNVDIKPFTNIAIYQSYTSNIFLDVVLNNSNNGTCIDVVGSNLALYGEIKKKLTEIRVKNVKVYEAKASSLITCLSEKVSTLFMLPRNSNFDLLKTTPDYFHQFNRSSFDEIINEERYSLEEASEMITDDGQIIYIIPTLNKKESRQIIRDFLLLHPTFSLLEERQYFPFEEEGCSLYYAKLMKMENRND